MTNLKNAVLQTLTLFRSLGTLLCCALPGLLVSLGAGAVVATTVSALPQLVWLSEHKVLLFAFAAIMLGISGVTTYLNRLAALSCRSCSGEIMSASASIIRHHVLYVTRTIRDRILLAFVAISND
jgi:hypothetical protein